MLSSIMTFGNLSEHYELVALKSAGISLRRILTPLFILILLMSAGAFFFANNVIPVANLKFKSLLYDVRTKKPALDIKEGTFYGGIDDYILRINKKDKNSNKIHGIKIYDHTRNRGNDILMTAEHGEMYTKDNNRWLVVKLYNGTRYEEMESKNPNKPTYPHSRISFASYEMKFDLSGFSLSRTNESLFRGGFDMLDIKQLSQYEDSNRTNLETTRRDVANYIKPFFTILSDSAKVLKPFAHFEKLNAKEPFCNSLVKYSIKGNATHAFQQAQTIRNFLEEQGRTEESYLDIITRYRIEWHRKFTLSLACITLFFIGAPLGAIIRKGGLGLPIVVAILMFVVFYVLSMVFERAGKSGAVDVVTGMWAPVALLMPVGLYLIWRANSDSINIDTIKSFFTNLIPSFTRKKV
ncbi:MAG: LptF/LptG family permease [Bacteroidetes bacterium]|nr:LptF/LptG family permease [Bacteroidota bacterium]